MQIFMKDLPCLSTDLDDWSTVTKKVGKSLPSWSLHSPGKWTANQQTHKYILSRR